MRVKDFNDEYIHQAAPRSPALYPKSISLFSSPENPLFSQLPNAVIPSAGEALSATWHLLRKDHSTATPGANGDVIELENMNVGPDYHGNCIKSRVI